MDESMNTSRFNNRQKTVFAVIVSIAVIVLLWIIFASSSSLKLESVTPEPGSTVVAEEATAVFQFNQEINNGDFNVLIFPEVNFDVLTIGNEVTVVLYGLLIKEDTSYTITLEDITGTSGDTLDVATTNFIVSVPNEALRFVSNLPVVKNGYIISYYSDEYILVAVTKQPYDRFVAEADAELSSNSVDSEVYRVVFEPDYESLPISPSEQLHPSGE